MVRSKLSFIFAAFGFSTEDLATALKVDKSLIYQIYTGETCDFSDRLEQLYTFARQWDNLCNIPPKYIKNTKLFSELCKDNFDYNNIKQYMYELAVITEKSKKPKNNIKTLASISEHDLITLNAFL